MPSDKDVRVYLAILELIRLIAASLAGFFGGQI